jgi:uncharacterized membrane protein
MPPDLFLYGEYCSAGRNHLKYPAIMLFYKTKSEVIHMADTSNQKAIFGLDENIASFLCYLIVWITGIIIYLLEKENKMVKFHALQSVLVFLPLNILYWILGYMFWWSGIGYILTMTVGIIMFILWIVLMIKAYQGERYKLPLVGDIADNATK